MTEYATRVVPVGDGDERTYTFECADGFSSSNWPLKKLAAARGAEHTAEHESAEPMRELHDFRAEHGLNGEPVTVVGFDDDKAGAR